MSWPVLSQPSALVVSSGDDDDGDDWSTGICDCCSDMRECCCVLWCCPCFACQTTKASGQCLCLPLLDVCGCVRPITTSMRASVRQRYGIRGSLCGDCLCSTFCLPCIWCQMSREMKRRKLPAVLGDIIHH